MPFIEQKGARVHYESWGNSSDPCLTLVNGTSRALSDFKAMASHFVRLGFFVVSLDNRGVGKTETPVPFTLKDCAEDIQAVMKALSIEKTFLLGISLGGMIALQAAALFPEKVQKLILVSTGFPKWLRTRKKFKDEEDYLQSYFSKEYLEKYPLVAKTLMKQMRSSFFDSSEKDRTAAQRKAYDQHPFENAYQFPFETTIIHGVEDEIIPNGAALELAETIKPSHLVQVPKVGHLFLVEAPKLFYEKIEEEIRIL